jgi:hypothetical protein
MLLLSCLQPAVWPPRHSPMRRDDVQFPTREPAQRKLAIAVASSLRATLATMGHRVLSTSYWVRPPAQQLPYGYYRPDCSGGQGSRQEYLCCRIMSPHGRPRTADKEAPHSRVAQGRLFEHADVRAALNSRIQRTFEATVPLTSPRLDFGSRISSPPGNLKSRVSSKFTEELKGTRPCHQKHAPASRSWLWRLS